MTFGLVYASHSLPKRQAIKLTFFTPCYHGCFQECPNLQLWFCVMQSNRITEEVATLQVKVFAWSPFGHQANQVASTKILVTMATKMFATSQGWVGLNGKIVVYYFQDTKLGLECMFLYFYLGQKLLIGTGVDKFVDVIL